MATLERKKKQIFNIVEDNQQGNSSEKYDDLTEDPVLESLSKEPMEYTNEPSNYLPKEVTDSLHSVKNICLSVLDLLLLQMVNNLPKKQSRRLSDPSCYDKITNSSNILTSISQNTSLLQSPMIRSFSSPPVSSNISDIHRILDSNKQRQQNDQDYTLCCSLAALLNNVYRLLELDSTANTQQRDGVPATSTHEDVVVLQQQLHTQVATFQQERAAGVISLDNADTSQEMKAIWNETDRLMNVVCNLITQKKQYQEQYAPPAYESQNSSNNQLDSKEDTLSPPAYESLIIPEYHLSFEKKEKESNSTSLNDSPPTTKDLDHLLDAIDRLFDVAPALNDQRASLNENQVKHLAAITLGKTIERLSRGRMEDQRASLPEKHQLLQELIQQIQKSASRSLNNQRVKLTPQQQKKLDFASVRHILERLDKGRYVNQDWISHEELLINDLTHTADLLVKSIDRPEYNRQRFHLSDTKERNLFMYGLFTKVESLEGYRLVDQDADFPTNAATTAEEREDDLQRILNHIYNTSKPQLDKQRASFTCSAIK